MNEPTVARRYARALYEEAHRAGEVAELDQDVELIQVSIERAPELNRFFQSPIISREKKLVVLRELFRPRVQPRTFKFLSLLVEKQREALISSIFRAYQHLRDEEEGVVEAQISVAKPIVDADSRQLQQALEAMTGKQVRLNVRQDPALVGGIVIRVGDTVYDGSVAHQLENLRDQLLNGRIAANKYYGNGNQTG